MLSNLEREFDLLTEMSRNSGELGEKSENLEEYFMEFLARLEISRYLQQEINLTFSSSGENSSVIKIENPFSLSFARTVFCHFHEDHFLGIGKKKHLMFIGIPK